MAWVLLRARNVGDHNKVPMAALRRAYADAACTDVTTRI